MSISCLSLLSWLLWFLIITRTFAQSGCEGDTSTYNQNGLIVSFENLCGKDITAQVDFLDPTNELTWSDCLDRCVEKEPLCYGFDFTPPGTASFSCWLMNATFPESSALTQSYPVDAAMLSPGVLSGLSDDCRTMGLLGCYQKNGQLGTGTTTTRIPSTTTRQRLPTTSSVMTATTAVITGAGGGVTTIIMTVVAGSTSTASSGPIPHDGGLSTGAKAGIGAGIGVVVLLAGIAGGVFLLKRRKRREQTVGGTAHPDVSEKIVDEDSHRRGRAELPAYQSQYPRAELESAGTSPTVMGKDDLYGLPELASPSRTFSAARQHQVHELDGSSWYQKRIGSVFSRR